MYKRVYIYYTHTYVHIIFKFEYLKWFKSFDRRTRCVSLMTKCWRVLRELLIDRQRYFTSIFNYRKWSRICIQNFRKVVKIKKQCRANRIATTIDRGHLLSNILIWNKQLALWVSRLFSIYHRPMLYVRFTQIMRA